LKSLDDEPVSLEMSSAEIVCGMSSGVTAVDATEADDVPSALMLCVVNVYAVPLVKFETVQEPEAPVTVQVSPPGDAVTKYEVGVPPDNGALTVTIAPRLIATAVACLGAAGQLALVFIPKSEFVNIERFVTVQILFWLPKRLVPVFVVKPLPTVTVCSVT
jgi:hypothetical protein